MLDIQRYQNVAVGNTVAECQKAYQALLATNGVLAESGVDTGAVEKQGTIAHIAQAVVEGNSHFYVKLDDGSIIRLSESRHSLLAFLGDMLGAGARGRDRGRPSSCSCCPRRSRGAL